MNKRLSLWLALGLMFFLASCGHTKNVTGTKAADKNKDIEQLRTGLEKARPDYQWLRMRGSIHYEDGEQKVSANQFMKLRNDSLIWVSVNVLIEVARGMATKDSAMIMNRTSKEYTVFPDSGLQRMIGIPGLSLQAVQSLLLAYPPFGIHDGARLVTKDNLYSVEYTDPTYKEDFDLDPATMRVTRYHYQRNNSEQVTVTYSDFKQVGEMHLPQKIELSLETPAKILISLDISDYNLLQADEAPFTIPASYKRVH